MLGSTSLFLEPEGGYDPWIEKQKETPRIVDDPMRSPFFEQLVREGIRPDLRGKVWQKLAKSDGLLRKNPGVYVTLVNLPSLVEERIRLDISRTFPGHPFYNPKATGQVSLFRVLKAYSVINPEVGYCQGMNFIVAIFLLYLEEEEAFWLLVQLMKSYGLAEMFRPDFPGLTLQLQKFEEDFMEELPQLHYHFLRQGIICAMFASKWLLTLFACRCTVPISSCIFDWFLLDSWDVIINIGICILKHHEKTLLSKRFDEILLFLETAPEKLGREIEIHYTDGRISSLPPTPPRSRTQRR